MNIHPLFVHFPIGLLATYSVLEVVGWVIPWLRRQSWFLGMKTVMLTLGTVAAFVAIITGGMAEDVVRASGNPRAFIIDTHEPFAMSTTITYSMLALVYLFTLFGEKLRTAQSFLGTAARVSAKVVGSPWIIVIALLGLTLITITGALGAALVYGPSIDPFVQFIYNALIGTPIS